MYSDNQEGVEFEEEQWYKGFDNNTVRKLGELSGRPKTETRSASLIEIRKLAGTDIMSLTDVEASASDAATSRGSTAVR